MWQEYYSVNSIRNALEVLTEKGERARIIAGATDLILEIERGIRPGIDTLVDITRIPDLDQIWIDEKNHIHLGPLVTHNQCAASNLIQDRAFPLAKAAIEIGAPQIRNRGTVAGNLITASPANDTITPLVALEARVKLLSIAGERVLFLKDFYSGVRKTAMQPGEILVDIYFPAMSKNQRGTFIKIGLRSAQAISVVNAATVIEFTDEMMAGSRVVKSAITLGAVAPKIIHAEQAQESLL